MSDRYDVIVVGAGIVGLTVARELVRRGAGKLLVLEKEPRLGVHSSGRNSGVLHAGIYYATDSLKAKVCADGSRRLQAYAAEKGIAVHKTGKVVVAPSAAHLPALQELFRRANENGIRAERLTPERLRELEPLAVTHDWALLSPDTAVIDSAAVLEHLAADLRAAGVELAIGEGVESLHPSGTMTTTQRTLSYGELVNCAGLHADRLAHQLGVGERYRILPFKGVYKKLSPALAARVNGSIYPAPDLGVPFLGVHITKNVFGDVYVGPTAMPAFGRENYRGLEGLSLRETPAMISNLASMYLQNRGGFRRMVAEELAKYRPATFLHAAQALAPAIGADDLTDSDKVGLRAQLVDERTKSFEMDFVVAPGPRSIHVLNAISPAFTASMALAELIVDRALGPR